MVIESCEKIHWHRKTATVLWQKIKPSRPKNPHRNAAHRLTSASASPLLLASVCAYQLLKMVCVKKKKNSQRTDGCVNLLFPRSVITQSMEAHREYKSDLLHRNFVRFCSKPCSSHRAVCRGRGLGSDHVSVYKSKPGGPQPSSGWIWSLFLFL